MIVLGIDPGFFVRLAGGHVVTARRILLATGVSDVLVNGQPVAALTRASR